MIASVHATPEAVSAAVHELACIERETGWSRVARVAEVLRRHGLAPSRSVLVGIRRIASHPACPLSKSQLCDLLAAHFVYSAEPLLRGSALTPSHAAAVAHLPVARRRSLLRAAIDEHLSVRTLRERAREARSELAHGRGRPKASHAARALTRMENAALALDEALSLLTDGSTLGGLQQRFEHVLEELRAALHSAVGRVFPAVEQADAESGPKRRDVRSCGHTGHDVLVPTVQLRVQQARHQHF